MYSALFLVSLLSLSAASCDSLTPSITFRLFVGRPLPGRFPPLFFVCSMLKFKISIVYDFPLEFRVLFQVLTYYEVDFIFPVHPGCTDVIFNSF